MSDTALKSKLTLKQRLFVNAYIGEARGNATKAAQIAGYKDPEQAGYENKKKQEIWQEIEDALRERTLQGKEVLERLTQHANASLEPFMYMSGDVAVIDLATEQAKQHLHLLKKVKCKRRSGGKPDDRWEEIETEIELHDPQTALVHLGRYHKLWVDRSEVGGDSAQPVIVKVLRGVSMDDL